MEKQENKNIKKIGKWAPKAYSTELLNKINDSIYSGEQESYKSLLDVLKEEYNLDNPRDLLLLDLVVKDFLRIQRIHKMLKDEGDFMTITSKKGNTYTKANEAGSLLNSVEIQLRSNLKELGLTKREHDRTKIEGMGKVGDFSNFLDAKDISTEDEK